MSEPTGNFQICDQRFVHTYLSLNKAKIIRETTKVWKLSAINKTIYEQSRPDNENATKHEKLEYLAKSYYSKLRSIIDKHAPEKRK